ncbi:MAG: hypothetical protein ACI97A_001723 [Planctomycetota bacterium]|jgi:hypothetical protein
MTRRSTKHGDNSPYKRKKTAEVVEEVAPTDEAVGVNDEPNQGSLEPGQMAQLIVDMRNGVVDRQAANSISGPLNDLAKAFAMQAEILRGVHETQVELKNTLKEDGKAEMMVNATDSLNSTFKGVKSVQQKLLDELDARGRHSRFNMVWVVAASVVILVTILGLFWWNNNLADSKTKELKKEMTAEFANQLDARYEEISNSDTTVDEWKDLADDARKNLRTVENNRNELKARVSDLERVAKKAEDQAKADASELERLRTESSMSKPENERLTAKVDDLQEQLTKTLERLEASRTEANHLRLEVIAKLNRVGAERMADKEEASNAKTTIIDREEAAAAKAILAKDPETKVAVAASSSEKVIDDINDLLSNHRGRSVFRIESVGKVGKHDLENVVLTESSVGRGIVKRIRAEKLSVSISSRGDIVEFNFQKGDVQQKRPGGAMGPWASFYNDRYRMTIYCLNGEKWMARSYGFFIVN